MKLLALITLVSMTIPVFAQAEEMRALCQGNDYELLKQTLASDLVIAEQRADAASLLGVLAEEGIIGPKCEEVITLGGFGIPEEKLQRFEITSQSGDRAFAVSIVTNKIEKQVTRISVKQQ